MKNLTSVETQRGWVSSFLCYERPKDMLVSGAVDLWGIQRIKGLLIAGVLPACWERNSP